MFILVPALLGLKGNLEMTLASRLSTAVRSWFVDKSLSIFTEDVSVFICSFPASNTQSSLVLMLHDILLADTP